MKRRLSGEEMERIFSYMEEGFGISLDYSKYEYNISPKGKVFISVPSPNMGTRFHVNTGLPFVRLSRRGTIKPTTAFIQLFGRLATRGIVKISAEDAKRFANGEDVKTSSKEEGYVIVRQGKYDLGVALLKEGILGNMIPKGKRMKVELI
ncbi:MAG: hypothetical protein JW754_05855 [Candidatus Aenigmarchaeota archaeon]|nr:hypothetical protein [Candidatus Aenigmarchaeota archaeon]